MKKELKIITFNKNEISRVLKLLKIDMRKKYLCSCCKKRLNKNNIGSINHNGKKIYCDNPICFTIYYLRDK